MFLVALTYTAPLAQIDALLAGHRAFLAEQYAAGSFLLSGRKEPRDGGLILARAPSRAALDAVLARDPFQVAGVARYEVTEFVPTMSAPALDFLREAA